MCFLLSVKGFQDVRFAVTKAYLKINHLFHSTRLVSNQCLYFESINEIIYSINNAG